MNKNLIISILMITVVAGFCFFIVNKSKIEFGVDIKLQVEQTAILVDGLEITLKKIDDHRCSGDAVCFWEGEVSFVLEISGGQLSKPGEVRISSKLTKSQTIEDYTVFFKDFSENSKSTSETSVTISIEYKKP